jgi:pyrroline-5-carboxylate reductase
MNSKVLFVGGGNMASAMIGGLLAQGHAKDRIQVVDPGEAACTKLRESFGVQCFTALDALAMQADVVVLAVKPQQMRQVAEGLRAHLRGQLIISIAAGIRLDDLSRWLGGYGNLVRTMPNTPALIRAGITGLFAPQGVSVQARRQAEQVIGAIGSSFWVDDETRMDAVTAVSGSGPAYVFYVLEALEQGARQFGFDGPTARQMALETVLGAAKLAADSPESFATLRERVTSKGGTTEAALKVMQEKAVAAGIIAGMQAAQARGAELGTLLGQA